ncbi:MAG: preprotein translocase subunit SecG [Flavobacteriaceae bacterium]|nr:preprotein translocase subunit SecG [Flavobacteriaceae bacterium]MBL6684915.1 preprotein translocase subunit SecG [Flavobacteriaceae bacterium]PDH52910.1 MAG: preprotein translocase subunit SecG [Cryomorphaceae bacterium MED-G14]|tara:strand:+ start:344 stop:679 length:336 start_codon:yes stop_codon:yes gene_type:complete
MNSIFTIILFSIIFLSFLLILVIMVQNPKGGGLSSSFGGGDSQQLGGVKQTSDFLDKSTWFLAVALLILILFSNITLNSGNQGSESELLNNESDFEIEEILENNETPSDSE